jgi:hypothetical protein
VDAEGLAAPVGEGDVAQPRLGDLAGGVGGPADMELAAGGLGEAALGLEHVVEVGQVAAPAFPGGEPHPGGRGVAVGCGEEVGVERVLVAGDEGDVVDEEIEPAEVLRLPGARGSGVDSEDHEALGRSAPFGWNTRRVDDTARFDAPGDRAARGALVVDHREALAARLDAGVDARVDGEGLGAAAGEQRRGGEHWRDERGDAESCPGTATCQPAVRQPAEREPAWRHPAGHRPAATAREGGAGPAHRERCPHQKCPGISAVGPLAAISAWVGQSYVPVARTWIR